jgi:hypothetical protein
LSDWHPQVRVLTIVVISRGREIFISLANTSSRSWNRITRRTTMMKTLLTITFMGTVLCASGTALARSQPAMNGHPSPGFEACFTRDWDGSHIRNGNASAGCSNAKYTMGWVVDRPGWHHVRVSGSDASISCKTTAGSIAGEYRGDVVTAANATGAIDVPDWGYVYTVCTVPFGKKLFKLDYWQ